MHRERNPTSYKLFKSSVRAACNKSFHSWVSASASNHRPWDLTVLTRPRTLPSFIMMRKLDGSPMSSKTEFWQELDGLFQNASKRPIDPSYTNILPSHPPRPWAPFRPDELTDAIEGHSVHSAPGIDHVTWRHIKAILKNATCRSKLADLFSACIFLGIWPAEFKYSQTVTIPKPKKPDYTTIKAYRPITLLSCLRKLATKTIAKHVQYESFAFNLLHPCQYGGATNKSTLDASIQVVNRIKHEWANGNVVTLLTFDLAQFFPSINHSVLINTLRAQGFANHFVNFIADYLTDRKTTYRWNNTTLAQIFDSSVGVVQGEVLSPPFANLTIAPILHHLSPIRSASCDANCPLEHDHLFFADDGSILVASKSFDTNISLLRPLFLAIASCLYKIGIVVEFEKSDLIHFYRRHVSLSSLPSLTVMDPFTLTIHTLPPRKCIRLLGFYLDSALTFRKHLSFYCHSAHSFLHSLSTTGTASKGLDASNRRLLYTSCVIPLLTYGFQLWFNPSFKSRKAHLKALDKVQLHAAR